MFFMFQAVQDAASQGGIGLVGAGLAIGLTVIGAGIGIGQIGAQMAAGIARQPDAAAKMQTAAIIMAALVEGVALFGLGLAFLKF